MKEWIHFHERSLYRIANGWLLVSMVLLGAERYLGIHRLGVLHFIVAFTVSAILAGMSDMTVKGRILCLSALFLLLCAGIAAGPAGSQAFRQSFFRWLVGRETAPREWELAFGLMQTAVFAAVCYFVQVLFERLPKLKEGAAVLLLGILVFCLLTRRELNHFGMAFMVCFLLLTWEERVQKHWKKKRIRERGTLIPVFWILPFFILYLLLMMIVPAPEKPYDWSWAKAIYRQLQESFRSYTQKIRWNDQEGFGMAFTGFSREGHLGGDLQEDVRAVMQVQVQPSTADHLYLTGMVYDTFDGRGWSRRQQGYPDETFLDTVQTLYAVRDHNQRYQRDYLKEIRVTVRYEDFSTGYVFAPLKTWRLEDGSGSDADIRCEDGALRWNGQKGYGTEYSLYCFAMNTGQPQFDLFLEAAGRTGEDGSPEEGINRKVWEQVTKECESRSGRIFTLQDMEDYEKAIYELYLDEVSLSQEMEETLQDIVRDARTDLEKLKSIENALSALTYTMVPGDLPASIGDAGDFLDHFLLESRQGYCTYFATAFVLLARAEGIPARYVQGYCVPIGEQGEAAVYSHMAHAWPEAYLEGVGWIPFEPTPGYGSRRYDPWKVQQPAEGVAEETLREWDPWAFSGGVPKEDAGDAEEMEDREEADPGKDTDPAYSWRLFGSAALVILSVCWGLLALDNALGRRRYGRMSPEERLRAEVVRNLKVISLFGLERESWETLEEFRVRIGALLGQHGEERKLSLGFMENYEKAVYGGRAAGEEMVRDAVEERERLLGLLKQEKKWSWIYCRIRLYLGRYRF